MLEENVKRTPDSMIKRLLRIPLVRILGLAVLIVLLIVAAAAVAGRLTNNEKKGVRDDYIYSVGTEGILDVQAFDGGLTVLQTDTLCYVDDLGGNIAANEHAFVNPVLRTAGRYALLFDRGSNLMRLEKNADVIQELKTDAVITNADLSMNGNYGYVLNAHEGYQSHFFAYNEKAEKLFEWGSASDYVTLVKFSKNGKKAVLVSFVAENAEFSSKVTAFDFDAADPIFSVELQNATVFAVKFLSGGAVAVFADNGVYRLNRKGEIETVREYSSTEINCCAVSDTALSALSLNLYGNEHNAEITLYNGRLRPVAAYTGSSAVSQIASDGRHAAVLSGNLLQILSKSSTVHTVSMEENGIKCVLKNNSVFVLTPGGIRSYSIYGSDTGDAFLEKMEQ